VYFSLMILPGVEAKDVLTANSLSLMIAGNFLIRMLM